MSLATIVSGHFGLPRNTRKLQARAIRAMQFHIKTALGVSKEYYQDTEATPLHGSGQGSVLASTLWLFISSIIMTLYQELATGMQMSNSAITEMIQQWIDGYVDNTSIFTSIDKIDGIPNSMTLAEQLQKDARVWERLLSATGGKLELTKCFYYILQWEFDSEGNPTHTSKEDLSSNGVQITIKEPDTNQLTEIKHLDCNTAHRTLGLYKTLTGDQKEQIKQTKTKSETISRAIGAAHFTRKQAKTAWNAIYITGVTYPFVATYLEENELVKIENSAIVNFLPKMGYNRNTARAVVYGPEEHGGIGIKSLYAEQLLAQITALIQHTRLESPLGRTILINLEWVQIIAGIQHPVFIDTRPIHHMEGKWFKSIRVISLQNVMRGPTQGSMDTKTLKKKQPMHYGSLQRLQRDNKNQQGENLSTGNNDYRHNQRRRNTNNQLFICGKTFQNNRESKTVYTRLATTTKTRTKILESMARSNTTHAEQGWKNLNTPTTTRSMDNKTGTHETGMELVRRYSDRRNTLQGGNKLSRTQSNNQGNAIPSSKGPNNRPTTNNGITNQHQQLPSSKNPNTNNVRRKQTEQTNTKNVRGTHGHTRGLGKKPIKDTRKC